MAEPKKVPMEALVDSSYEGIPFHTGDIIEVDEQYVETVILARLAVPVDRVERSQKAREGPAAEEKPAAGKPRVVPKKA